MQEYILEMIDISKTFPGVKALDHVNFRVKKGEIHALCGENGAGKSTLIKILSGVYPHGTYEGQILINGVEQKFNKIQESIDAGLATIYQELTLVKYLDIVENIFLGYEILTNGIIDYGQQYAITQKVLEEVGLNVEPSTQVINLSVGQQQLVEISKAIVKKANIIILDEPTSALTEEESKNLLELMHDFRDRGITCIYISHKLDEVFSIADTITVLRDGLVVSSHRREDINQEKLISLMVGREISQQFPYVPHVKGEPIFKIENWTVYNPEIPEKKKLDNINLTVHRGEILGIAGLMGAGRTELFLSILGLYGENITGELILEGKKVVNKTPKDAIDNKICYLSEDRKGNGLVLGMDVKQNITLPNLEKITNNNIINENEEIHLAEVACKELDIRTPSIEQYVGNLSGGNQQKVVVAKWLLSNPKVLILDEPTRGIDVGAKRELYNIINKLVEDGVGVILISSELQEVIGMSNRILVMDDGKIRAEFTHDEVTQEKVMLYATGGKQ